MINLFSSDWARERPTYSELPRSTKIKIIAGLVASALVPLLISIALIVGMVTGALPFLPVAPFALAFLFTTVTLPLLITDISLAKYIHFPCMDIDQ